MREGIRFLKGNRRIDLIKADPTMTILDWLRLDQRQTGTKEGCNEGDCGACTVIIGRIENNRIRYRAVNACIQLLATLDGARLLTVEDLAEPDGTLNPVQKAMVECHGSQCGFCTPGFVMSLTALLQQHDKVPGEEEINDALSGNLCRCTGYAPIARAAHRAFDLKQQNMDNDPKLLEHLQDDKTIHLGQNNRSFYAPARLSELLLLLEQEPQARVIAGTTDVGLWITKQMRILDEVIWLGRIRELKEIRKTQNGLQIGSAVTWSEAMAPLIDLYPEMRDMLRRFASLPIRNVATIGGNIANGSPIGDGSPALIAARATITLQTAKNHRSLPLEAFFLAYGKQDLEQGEIITNINIPTPEPGTIYRCYKLSKRFDQDISAVLGAFSITIQNGKASDICLAFGGMAAIPKRAHNTEKAISGKPLDEVTLKSAIRTLSEDFKPLDDMRASADYRLKAAAGMLQRLWIEATTTEVPTRVQNLTSAAYE